MSSASNSEVQSNIEFSSSLAQNRTQSTGIASISTFCPLFRPGKITTQQISFGRVIGHGSWGTVKLAQDKETGRALAVKETRKDRLQSGKNVERVMKERAILANARHPLIVDFYSTCQDLEKLYLVMEFVQGGELLSLLNKRGRLTTAEMRFYAAEVTSVLSYLHSQGIVYRDLKPENVLIAQSGHIKLTDFGCAKKLRNGERTFTFCGTPEYLAPEMLNLSGHDIAVDWWTVGIFLHELLTGTSPFTAESVYTIYSNIITADYVPPKDADNETRHLLTGLLDKDPQHRFTCEKVIGHRFFSGLDWQRLETLRPVYVPAVKTALDAQNFQWYAEEQETEGEISDQTAFLGY